MEKNNQSFHNPLLSKLTFLNFIVGILCLAVQVLIFGFSGLWECCVIYVTVMMVSLIFCFEAYRSNIFFFLIGGEIGPVASIIFGYYNRLYPILIFVYGGLNLLLFCYELVLFLKKKTIKKNTRWRMRSLICYLGVVILVLTMNFVSLFGTTYRGYPMQWDHYYMAECSEGGSIQKETYSTYIYNTDGTIATAQEKYCYVYTPYQYDDSQEYDILYLIHGGHENAEQWMMDERMAFNKNMVDHLIQDKIIKPLIVVMPTFYHYNDYNHASNAHTSRSYSTEPDYVDAPANFKYELRNDLIPAIETKYATYSRKNISSDSLIQSREHRGIAGLSMGSMTSLKSGLCSSLDYFANFGCFSGTNMTGKDVLNQIHVNGFDQYEIKYLYFASGTLDHCYEETKEVYNELVRDSRFTKGANISMDVMQYQAHYDYEWPSDLFNYLHHVFQA